MGSKKTSVFIPYQSQRAPQWWFDKKGSDARTGASERGVCDTDMQDAPSDSGVTDHDATRSSNFNRPMYYRLDVPKGLQSPFHKRIPEDGKMSHLTTDALRIFLRANDCNPDSWEDNFPPMKTLTNGLEFFSAATTGWDRTTKSALKQFLNMQGEDAGEPRSVMFGNEWDTQGIKALVSFLNKHGATLSNQHAAFPGPLHATFSTMSKEVIIALQHFLNTEAFMAEDLDEYTAKLAHGIPSYEDIHDNEHNHMLRTSVNDGNEPNPLRMSSHDHFVGM